MLHEPSYLKGKRQKSQWNNSFKKSQMKLCYLKIHFTDSFWKRRETYLNQLIFKLDLNKATFILQRQSSWYNVGL